VIRDKQSQAAMGRYRVLILKSKALDTEITTEMINTALHSNWVAGFRFCLE